MVLFLFSYGIITLFQVLVVLAGSKCHLLKHFLWAVTNSKSVHCRVLMKSFQPSATLGS